MTRAELDAQHAYKSSTMNLSNDRTSISDLIWGNGAVKAGPVNSSRIITSSSDSMKKTFSAKTTPEPVIGD